MELTKSAIDLMFVNNKHRVMTCGTIISTISVHLIVFCVVKSGVTKAPPRKLEYRSYKNYDKTLELLTGSILLIAAITLMKQ